MKEIEEFEALAVAIAPLLAGHPPEVIGAVLADLTATLIAGHSSLDSTEETERVREEMLQLFIKTVRALVPHNEKMFAAAPKRH
jgi:hypothetical protein